MLYTTRAVAEALHISLNVVRNDVARGMIRVHRTDLHLGNRFTHEEVMSYYEWRQSLPHRKYPPPSTVLRVLRRCTAYQLTKVHGPANTAKYLGCTRTELARSTYNYRQSKRKAPNART
jgi:hypothetical protein